MILKNKYEGGRGSTQLHSLSLEGKVGRKDTQGLVGLIGKVGLYLVLLVRNLLR